MKTVEKRRTPVSSKQQVLVEFKVNRKVAEQDASLLLATKLMNSLKIKFDKSYNPVPIRPTDKEKVAMIKAKEDNIHYLIRASIEKTEEEKIKKHSDVVAIWTDFMVGPANCPDNGLSIGSFADVMSQSGVNALRNMGNYGHDVFVGVVDSGITSLTQDLVDGQSPPNRIGIIDGWGYTPDGLAPGRYSGWNYHGNMMAWDVRLIAPGCELLDLRIANRSDSSEFAAPISNVVNAYNWAIEFQNRPWGRTPFILVNGWSLSDPNIDPEYGQTNHHPIYRIVSNAIDDGIIVLFPAGNCGSGCPNGNCGTNTGPGRSIWGLNGAPKVITVGAANSRCEYLEYSSEGPAISYVMGSYVIGTDPSTSLSFGLPVETRKPDFCSISHFPGYTPCDNGTSAATAVAAGIIALLMSGPYPVPSHREIKQALIRQATNISMSPDPWNPQTGAGLINAARTFNYLRDL